MLGVERAYCIGEGVPALSGKVWRRASLGSSHRPDPFSRQIVTTPLWMASTERVDGPPAPVFAEVEFATDAAWAAAARGMAARSCRLHEGMIFELWVVVLGEAEARAAWKPTWITSDGTSQVLAFPPQATRWLAEATPAERGRAAATWAQLPYLGSAGDTGAQELGECLLRILSTLGERAREAGASLVVELSGYVAP